MLKRLICLIMGHKLSFYKILIETFTYEDGSIAISKSTFCDRCDAFKAIK